MTKVLVVDDEPAVLESTALLLKDLGFDVVTCSDPTRVVALLNAERPDVLLQDVRMPGLEVDKLVGRIRRDPRVATTPIVLFSASMEILAIQERLRVQGILEKPFRPEDVEGAIRAAVRSRGEAERRATVGRGPS